MVIRLGQLQYGPWARSILAQPRWLGQVESKHKKIKREGLLGYQSTQPYLTGSSPDGWAKSRPLNK